MKKFVLTCLTLSVVVSSTMFADTQKVDTLVIYSKGAKNLYGNDIDSRIDQLISTTNQIYKDSGLDINLNPVKVIEYDKLSDSETSADVLSEVQKDQYIKDLREQVGADEVIIYRPYANDGVCGIAYQNNALGDASTASWAKDYTYAHISIDCSSFVTAHEVGHNMGLGHSYLQGSEGAFTYARGHGVVNEFVTVMAYQDTYNAKSTIYKFSSPKLDCDGYPCGVPEGYDDEADAVKALFQTVPYLASFRESVDAGDTNETVDDNTTTDDGKTLLDKQKEIVKKAIEKLKELKDIYKNNKNTFYDKYKECKQLIRDYRAGKVSYSDLKAFYYDELLVAYNNYKDSYYDYVDYYKNVYLVELEKLKELESQYK